MKFTPAQKTAIEHAGPGDLCVIAGPGSGKTRVLVSRFAWLVRQKRCSPDEILAVTFTRKAALEMKKRLAGDLSEAQAEQAHVSTIDSFCARLLREHAIEAGLDPDFGQLEPIDAEVELYGWVEKALDQSWEEDPRGALGFANAFRLKNDRGGMDVPRHVFGLIESARCWGDVPQSKMHGDRHEPYRAWLAGLGRKALALFAEDKQRRGLMDFSDLTSRAVDLLRDGKFSIPLRYKHILLDENQDTNPQQSDLIRLLQKHCDAPLFAVGDLNQSIYAFRNADPTVFEAFRDAVKLSGKVVDLTDNFRSRSEILTAARVLTARSGGVIEQPLRAGREFGPKKEPAVEILLSRRGGDEQEARWAAKRIIELRDELRLGKDGRPANWRDFAVLVRTNNSLGVFADGLRWAGVPYVVNAGRSFFQTSEVRDLLALLRALDNPRDEVHLAAVLRSPMAGVADATLLALKADRHIDLFRAMTNPLEGLAPEEQQKLSRFHALFQHYRQRRESMPLNVLLTQVAAKTGFDAWLLTQEGGLQRSANVQKLAGLAGRAMTSAGSFRGAVQRLDAMSASSAGEGEASLPDDSTDAVRLMTVHAAKGLEFPVVVLGSIQNAGKAGTDPILYSREAGVGVRWSDIDKDAEGEGDPPYNLLYPLAKKSRQDEDARLFYVAMTRAEDHLVLSAGWGKQVRMTGWTALLKKELGLTPAKNSPGVLTAEKHGLVYRMTTLDETPEKPESVAGSVIAAQPVFVEKRATTLGQQDSEASVTGVSLFGVCPRRYYLSRYLGLEAGSDSREEQQSDETTGTQQISAMELGSETHALLAGTLPRLEASAEACSLADVFEGHSLGARLRQANLVEREREVLFPVGTSSHLVRGVIDLYFEDAAGSVLLDYKTDRVTTADIVAKAEEYALQMRLYALALELEGRRPAKAMLFFLRLGQAVEATIDRQALTEAARTVEEFFLAQESQEFPLKIGGHCRRCPHFGGLCPAQLPEKPNNTGKGQMKLFPG